MGATLLAGCVVTLLLAAPVYLLVFAAFRGPGDYLPFESGAQWTLDNFVRFYSEQSLYTEIMPNTVQFALGSVALAYGLGFLLAWVLSRNEVPAKSLLVILLTLPLVMPVPALALAWMQLLGPNAGWLNKGLRELGGLAGGSGPFNVFSMWGLIWCQAMSSVPFAFLLLRPAVTAISRDGEEAGYLSGAMPWTTFVRLTLPRIVPSLMAPLLLMLIIHMELVEYPYIIGTAAQINVLGTRLLWELNNPGGLPDMGVMAAAAMSLLLLSLAALWLYQRTSSREEGFRTSSERQLRRVALDPAWLKRTGILAAWIYIAVAVCLPLLALVASSLGIGSPDVLLKPSAWNLDGYRSLLLKTGFWSAACNTLFVALGSAFVATAVGFGVALTTARQTGHFARLVEGASMLSIGIPSLILAAGVMVLYLTLPIGVYGTVWILILAYSCRIAISTRMAHASFAQIHPSMLDAAHVSGAGWVAARVKICLPLMLPAMLSTLAIYVIAGAREFTIPLLLYSPDNAVLSVMVMQLYQSGSSQQAAVAALASVVACTVMLGVVMVLGRRYMLRGVHT